MLKTSKSKIVTMSGLALAGAFIVSSVVPAIATPASCSGFDSNALSITGITSCVVPTGMTSIDVTTTGAGGGGGGVTGSGNTSLGGNGAIVTTTIAVTPGETLTLHIGTGGGASSNNSFAGGGGGGWSAIYRGSTLLVAAGAGGGGGSTDNGSSGLTNVAFVGGNGGQVGGNGTPAYFGIYGGDESGSGTGGTATAGGVAGQRASGIPAGVAGTSSNGGAGANACGGTASAGGALWQGGTADGGCSGQGSGGGGGAGYFGGAGGNTSYGTGGGSGGGGSSYIASGSATYSLASNAGAAATAGGNGRIVLSAYNPTPAQSTLTLTPGFVVGDLAPNAPVTLGGTDLQASSAWSADIRSTPVIFASGTTDGSGNFSLASNLPTNVGPGEHTITLYGTSISGAAWTRVLYITVGDNLRVTYMSTTAAEGRLAATGTNPSWGIVTGLTLLGIGTLLSVFSVRRRKNI